jgi:hypothetical protein
MSDTPPTMPPASGADAVKTFIGDLARPFAIIVTSGAAAAATIILANKVSSDAAAIFIGAVLSGVAVLYGAKSWEAAQTAKQSANVEVAKAQNSTPGGAA